MPAAQKCILIRFGDNDFAKTLRAFADVVSFHRESYEPDFLTKEKVAELWNMLAPGLYYLAQNCGRYAAKAPNALASYLSINPDAVYLDSEAIKHIDDNTSQWNHSWVYIGLDGSPNTII
jgi:hypothetical protein